MSTDQVECTVHLPHRDLQIGISSEIRYSNSSLSLSPDSSCSISTLSEASSSPDVNVLECCFSDSSPLDNTNNLCGISTNLNQTFIATPDNGNENFWNANLTPVYSHGSFSENTETGGISAVASPDSAVRQSQLGSCEISRRASTENGCYSLSPGEMVIRSNSFCLEDQSLLVVSSLEDSSISYAAGNEALLAESNLPLTTQPDVDEKSPERVTEETRDHPCLGMTFTQGQLPDEENHMATSNSLVALPSENEGGLLTTFVCEKSQVDCGNEAQLLFPESLAPEQGKTLVSTLSAVQEINNIHTSTPIQNIGDKVPSLPPLSESPCTGNKAGARSHPVKQQQISINSKNLVVGLPPSTVKVKKLEIKKFPKLDFRSVKSKILTRNVHQSAAPGSVLQHKLAQVNMNSKLTEVCRRATIRTSPGKTKTSTTGVTTTPKVNGAQRQGAANLGLTVMHNRATNMRSSAIQCRNASSETEHAASSPMADTITQHAGNQTFCLSSLEKSTDESEQIDPKPTPWKGMSHKIGVRPGSVLGQDKAPLLKTRLRCCSESSSSLSRPFKEVKTTVKFLRQTKQGDLNCSSQKKGDIQAKATKRPTENTTRAVKKISLVAESSNSATAEASLDEGKVRVQERPSPRRLKEALLSQAVAKPRPFTPPTRQRQPTLGRDECRTSRAVVTPQSKQKSSIGSRRAQATRETSLGNTSIKPQLNGSLPPQTPSRASLMGLPPTPASRLPHKTLGPSTLHKPSERDGSIQVSGAAVHKQTPLKAVVLKARLFTTPAKNTGQSCKPAAFASKGASNSTVNPMKRTNSVRLVGPTSSGNVDKNKPKASSGQQASQQQASQPSQVNGPPDVVPASASKGRRKDQSIQQLKGLLASSNCRFEAFAIVLQQILTERDEATRQCRDLSQDLVNLREELVCSVHSSERLEKEKEELRVSLEDALQELQEQHQKDMAELERRLQDFYQAEWDKVHLTYQEEADKCKSLMQQQMGELKATHEAMKQELQNSHTEQLQSVKEQYENSLEELTEVHNQELQSLDKSLKDTETVLSEQIEALSVENKSLIEKLTAEDNRWKELANRSQKDSHTLYLEQELDSLKVVLDIKNKQLHQQEKKLMELDKLKDKNVKLDESLKKVQQENEDLKARMDRHAALSRQLSTEQAVLQESLQKESKENKRLSMENEELLWKLYNGDLNSPRRISPTSASPSHSFSFQSPSSSNLLSSPSVSPR